ncbi:MULTISPECIES: NADH-quinone oxidoreductase subunit C [unclassified Paenibacillus]|uniref:NADH-quinone oxidoreductase subunit C n=1 Tax=unclassified Paenibacillus TaxID=185978 RepID=UPI001AE40A01|nr:MULTISPECIES: NADH-quinone oxidoreductase subunit C [unclassified Paenibacillus]MBP1153199.1 NADH-quinone oxidoreductase subunit C [Paenibacillus sp. PvP091]MBP1171418.1 NADH-quinone oxidoreductase subunit C [Paenibacillus sp. PvR098]MBP2442446.1 NADH-quinone oxidoreductase subunit C [Paenibacillus sp. PvP052]
MSDEQKRDQSSSSASEEQKTKAEANQKPQDGEASVTMSGEPAVVEGAEVTKTGGAGEPPGGYAGADASKSEESKAAASEPKEPRAEAAESGDAPAVERAAPSDAEKEAKAKAAAEARAARANARAAKTGGAEPDAPKEPSPNQPLLDRIAAILKGYGEDLVQEAFINEKGGHIPYLIIKGDEWPAVAELLKTHPELKLNYLRNVSGIDMETHLEVAYHLISLETKREYCIKIKTDREAPSIPSVTPVWPTADWNEREIYDLFGIDFPGHPDLRRIMMADDWVGHPLRKDYEPLDPEV